MKVNEGDRLVIESERVGQSPRTGTVEEVLSLDPLRMRVRWENDRESTVTPDAAAPASSTPQLRTLRAA